MRSTTDANGITEGVIWKQLLLFFFPILFGTFFQQLYNTADAAIVGRYVGTQALAAVGGSTGILINLMVNLLVGISAGATIVVAQLFGAQRPQEVQQTVHSSMALALAAGSVMTLLGLLVAPWALRAMGTPPEIIGLSTGYIRVIFLGLVPSFVYNIGAAVMRAVGDTRRPLYFLIITCFLNIALDLLFVVTLGLGVLGAAIATVISQFVSAVLVLIALMRAEYPCKLIPRQIGFCGPMLRRVVQVGLPAGLQSNMYAISNVLIQACFNSFGVATVAAWTAFGKIDGFFWMVMSAYGVSVMTFVGQNYGAQKFDRIRKSVRICLGMALGTAVFFSALLCVFATPLLQIFIGADASATTLGAWMLRRMVPFYFAYVCVEIFAGAIRGTGNALTPMLMTCFGICVLRVLWVAFVMPGHWKLEFLIISYPITWAATSLLFIVYYVSSNWLGDRLPACSRRVKRRPA